MCKDLAVPEILEIVHRINVEDTKVREEARETRRKVREEAKRKKKEEEREMVESIFATMRVSKEDIERLMMKSKENV